MCGHTSCSYGVDCYRTSTLSFLVHSSRLFSFSVHSRDHFPGPFVKMISSRMISSLSFSLSSRLYIRVFVCRVGVVDSAVASDPLVVFSLFSFSFLVHRRSFSNKATGRFTSDLPLFIRSLTSLSHPLIECIWLCC